MDKSKKKSSIFDTSVMFLAIIALLIVPKTIRGAIKNKSDSYIRDRVVELVNGDSYCSGEQVIGHSGTNYILTAGHCNNLARDGSIEVVTEDGEHLLRSVIAEDPNSDLLLLEGIPNLYGLSIAREIDFPQHVKTFTHGKGFDTYKTEGELVQILNIKVMLQGMPAEKCTMPKHQLYSEDSAFGLQYICLLHVDEVVTTAMLVPGSSGGAVVDESGKLVGVVSAVDVVSEGCGNFGFLVQLSDIQKFLRSY